MSDIDLTKMDLPAGGAEYWRAIAQRVSDEAERDGFIITVERRSVNPLSPKMRDHIAHIEVREKR